MADSNPSLSVEELELFHQFFSVVASSGLESTASLQLFYHRVDDIMVSMRRKDDDEVDRKARNLSNTEVKAVNIMFGNSAVTSRLFSGSSITDLAVLYYQAVVEDEQTVMTVESLDSYLGWENFEDDDDVCDPKTGTSSKAPTSGGMICKAIGFLGQLGRQSGLSRRQRKERETTRIHLYRQCEGFMERCGVQQDLLIEERRQREKNHVQRGGADSEWMRDWLKRYRQMLLSHDAVEDELCRRLDDAQWPHMKQFLFEHKAWLQEAKKSA